MTQTITRRAAIATGLGAAAALRSRRARAADLAALEAAARKEGAVTWYIAQIDTETAEAAGRAFSQRYPGIAVTVMRTTGQVAYQRLQQDLKNNSPQCDVFSSTDVAHYPALIKQGALARYEPQNAAGLAPAFRDFGEPGFYYPTNATVYGLIYNTKSVPVADAPKAWTDMLDPRWKGQIALGHPAFSGYFGYWTLAMTKTYGWSFFEKLERNKPLIGRSGLDPLTNLNAGESRIGNCPLNGALLQADKGNPIAFAYAADGTVLCIGPAAIMANAPHPNAARLWMEWLLSPEGARFNVETRMDPVRDDVPMRGGMRQISDLKLIPLTVAEIAKGVPDIIERWRDTFGS